ncbi:D-alanyl-D-alanine carboxypeptidase [Pseudolabrys taiwanensis]|uniref:serine-type D-Ala-D-Ala carboxypeptidase n=1 Tax=Pseudolabrys taiwanensis TaxID=331696 RepID=A0A345ZSP7_9HYPH|nr:D-alanyl-D-alanine carboxypeptidase family protein [Pseudolabrys taiwanensis]AXK79944.1 D-alanyl-D-alanine carboxypeptidase [Pseudolabrys taiwanensis]
MALGLKIARVAVAALVTAGLLASPVLAQRGRDATAQPKKDEPQITAPHAILIDAENGGVLYERDPDKLIFPASLAKLMTAEYVFHEIKEGRIKLTDEYPVSENAWRKGGAPSGTSTMFAALHSRVSVDDLLKGLAIQSANDACIVLAEAIAGSEAEFAAKMTQRARQIGLTQSVFTNSNGLPDPGTKVTTRELATLAREIILNYPEFYKYFGEPEFTWNKIRQHNRNPLLPMGIGADGLKTGFTKDAGYGLVGSAVQNDLRLIVVVNGLKTPKERAEEAKKLLEWGFKSFEQRLLFADGQEIGAAKVYGGASGRVPLVATGAVKVMMPKAGGDKLIARIAYTGPVPAPVTAGQQIGSLKVWRNDKLVLTQPLKATESVAKGSLSQRALDAVTELVIALFRSGAERL